MVLFTWTGVFTKLPVLQSLKNRVCVWEQRQYDAPLGGGPASQGREQQPSVAVHSIWMTLYLLNYPFSLIKVYFFLSYIKKFF